MWYRDMNKQMLLKKWCQKTCLTEGCHKPSICKKKKNKKEKEIKKKEKNTINLQSIIKQSAIKWGMPSETWVMRLLCHLSERLGGGRRCKKRCRSIHIQAVRLTGFHNRLLKGMQKCKHQQGPWTCGWMKVPFTKTRKLKEQTWW